MYTFHSNIYSSEDLNMQLVDLSNEESNTAPSVTVKPFPEAVKSEKPDLILPIVELNVWQILTCTCI